MFAIIKLAICTGFLTPCVYVKILKDICCFKVSKINQLEYYISEHVFMSGTFEQKVSNSRNYKVIADRHVER